MNEAILAPFIRLGESFIHVVPRLFAAGVMLLVFWGLATIARMLARGVARVAPSPKLQHLLERFSYYGVWLVGGVAAVDALGFDPVAVATGLGLTGIAGDAFV